MNYCTPTKRRTRSPWPTAARRLAGIIVMTILALVAAACGSSPSSIGAGGSSNAGGSTSTQSTNSDKVLAFAHCMRTQGVSNFPDPNSSGQFDKVTLGQLAHSNSRYQAANDACHHLLPTPSVAQQRNKLAQGLEFSRCMRAHGVTNFPDPGSDGVIPDPATLGIDQGSRRFEAANQACGKYRPPYVPSNAAYNAYERSNG